MSHPALFELLSFWFADTVDDPASIEGRMGWWFSADEERDQLMADRFNGLVEECAGGHHYHWFDGREGHADREDHRGVRRPLSLPRPQPGHVGAA